MNSEHAPEPSGEPQWRGTYVPSRVTAAGTVVRDRSVAPASWYLTPWEVEETLTRGTDFSHLVDRTDPRLPHSVTSHPGPATVTITCTTCGHTGARSADFSEHSLSCTQQALIEKPAPKRYANPSCSEAWMTAAKAGTLVQALDPGCPPRDGDTVEQWTVELSFDVDAHSRDHAEQIADLLAMITGGRISGVS